MAQAEQKRTRGSVFTVFCGRRLWMTGVLTAYHALDPLAAALIRIRRRVFIRRNSAKNLRLTPFAAKFFATENPPKILLRSTKMRGETQSCPLYSRQTFAISD